MAVEDKVKDIIVEQLGVNADQVKPEASLTIWVQILWTQLSW